MSYLDEVEARLRGDHLEQGHVLGYSDSADSWQEWQDHVIRFVREAVLASYRNGQAVSKPARKGGQASALAAGKLKPVQ